MAVVVAIGSSFSPSTYTLKCTRIKHCTSDSLLRISAPMRIMVPPLSRSCAIEPFFVVSAPWRSVHRVSVVVAQEETSVAESAVEEEQVVSKGGGGEEANDQISSVNTKLYFGNLPYNVDSAQLAAIIQDYGTPELVEVLYHRETGRSRGFTFVTMSTVEDCNAVIENLDGSQYMGRSLRVNFSDKPKPKEPLYPETER